METIFLAIFAFCALFTFVSAALGAVTGIDHGFGHGHGGAHAPAPHAHANAHGHVTGHGHATTDWLRSTPLLNGSSAMAFLTCFGAAGFLLKDTAPAEIVRAIELVHAGDGMLSPTVTRRLISMVAGDSDAGARAEQARDRLATLSPRERDVALAVGRGETNAEIAAALHLSVATVKAHVSRLLDKLDVDNRVQIALLVQAAGEH